MVERDLVMPRLGLTMKQGRVTRWYKGPGDTFRRGEPLLQVTTEKVAVDVEAAYDGRLLEVVVPPGKTVPVGAPIARVEAAEAAEAAVSPSAGAGPEGRVTEDDVRAFAARPGGASARPAAAPAARRAGDEVVPHSEWRLATAEKMAAAARAVAPVTLHRSVDFTRARALLETPAARAAGAGPLDVVLKAVADSLPEHPDLNATYTGEALLRHGEVNLGAALALPGGLIVPVLRSADRLSLPELARLRREVWNRARAGGLGPDDATGGTFTVTNLGPLGVEGFTPIINLPEVAVLGVGRIADRLVAEGDRIVARPCLTLSLTFDHRAVDGAPAAEFLARVASRIEGSAALLAPPAARPKRVPKEAAGAAVAAGAADRYDLVIVGAGPAGFTAATTAAEAGARVALVEAEAVGGICLNRGCIPTKAALEQLSCREAGKGGAPLHEKVEAVVSAIRFGAEETLAELGVTVVRGDAGLEPGEPGGPPRVRVGDRLLTGTAVLVAPGSEPIPIPIPPELGGPVISVEDLLTRDWNPRRALVVGGGTGGVEASRILALAGAEVTLVERLPSLLPGEEADVGELVRLGLEDLGVAVHTGTDLASLAGAGLHGAGGGGAGGEVTAAGPGAGAFDLIVLAVGRRARLGSLGLDRLGVPGLIDERGFVRVDDHLRTPLAGLYAAGDVTGPPYWAHRAMEQGRAAAYNVLSGIEGFPAWITPRPGPAPELIPRVVFSAPEFGAVGLGRGLAVATGFNVVVGSASMGASSRARAAGKGEGFVRVIGDRATGRLLGVEAACPAATEIVAAGLAALKAGYALADLGGLPFAHPTYAEALGDAARDALRQCRS